MFIRQLIHFLGPTHKYDTSPTLFLEHVFRTLAAGVVHFWVLKDSISRISTGPTLLIADSQVYNTMYISFHMSNDSSVIVDTEIFCTSAMFLFSIFTKYYLMLHILLFYTKCQDPKFNVPGDV
jgi:hypothetical protein